MGSLCGQTKTTRKHSRGQIQCHQLLRYANFAQAAAFDAHGGTLLCMLRSFKEVALLLLALLPMQQPLEHGRVNGQAKKESKPEASKKPRSPTPSKDAKRR